MSTKQKIMDQFEKNTNRKIVGIYNYSIRFYLINAVINDIKDDRNGSFFIMDKNTGDYRSFSPIEDLDKFDAAIQNGKID